MQVSTVTAANQAHAADLNAPSEISDHASAHPQASHSASHPAFLSAFLSGEFISHVLTVGVTSACDHLKLTLTTTIAEKGDVYFAEALKQGRASAQQLMVWSKQHPLKAACALTAAFGVVTVALAVAQSRRHAPVETSGCVEAPPALIATTEPLPSTREADPMINA
jgi:hypothetical protein